MSKRELAGRGMLLGIAFLVVVGLAVFVLPKPRVVSGGTFTTPVWVNNSPSPECICDDCGCERPSEWYQTVSVRTGEARLSFPICAVEEMNGWLPIGVLWRSMNAGVTEVGRGMIPSWGIMVQKNILDAGNPNGAGGHEAIVYRPDGLTIRYGWSGSAYSTSHCDVHDALTTNGSGNYVLTDLQANAWTFNAGGMPTSYVDRNSNATNYSFNGSHQLTSITTNRGETISFSQNGNGFVSAITIPGGASWTLGYDANDNLTTIGSPATADQPSGSTTTISYDGSDRITGVQDGNADTPWTYAWVTGTDQVSVITGSTISFAYSTRRTDVTDRVGNVVRYFYSGASITSVDLYEGGVSKYATNYTYSGSELVTIVKPLGNRIDFTYDGSGHRTERRRKTTDTGSTSGTDIVEAWTYTSNFPVSHTDPRGNVTSYGRDGAGNLTSISFPTVTSRRRSRRSRRRSR